MDIAYLGTNKFKSSKKRKKTMVIRQAHKKDLPQILAFMGIGQAKRKDWHVSAEKFVESYITNKHNFFLICLKNGKIEGTINGELWDDKGFAYLGEIRAIGKKREEIIQNMFKQFIVFCKKKNVKIINTYVQKKKKKQIEVYLSLGMKKRGEHFYFERRI